MARENRPPRRQEENDGLIKKTIEINRVSKTVKGGKNMRFAALVVVGDGNGKVGYGQGKSKEVPEAIEKATQAAKKNMINVPIVDTTIPHETIGKFGKGAVLMRSRYRRYRGRSRPCGHGSSGHQEHQNEVSRYAECGQLHQGDDRGSLFPENGGRSRCASRQVRGRDRGLRRR